MQTGVMDEQALRLRQLEALSELSAVAIRAELPGELMERAVQRVAEVYEADYCKVLELLPGGAELLLKAGVGWMKGLVGHATVGADWDSQAGYTLLKGHSIIVEDLQVERRFRGPALLHAHRVTSGISVVIPGVEEPYGVLGVHTRERRTFDEHDGTFLQAVANIIGAKVALAQRA